tara:strand:- start:322 stop:654 length:333 start_codon:yes stop_codon:yes gene_type:complete
MLGVYVMSSLQHIKSSRIENRCSDEQKNTLKRAADLLGVTLSSFTLEASLEKAQKIISKNAMLELSIRDQEMFAEALLNPAMPNDALLAAKNKFDKKNKNQNDNISNSAS